MTLKQKVFSASLVITLLLTPTVVVLPVYAANGTTNFTPNFFQGLVQFIAQKFGLDKTQVQNTVNEYHSQHLQQIQQKMQANDKKRLDNLVSQGEITSSQKQQIIDEQNKLKSEYNPQNLKGKTPTERRATLQKERDEIQAWSKDTGIDAKYLMPRFMRFGRMGAFDRWNNIAAPSGITTPTSSI